MSEDLRERIAVALYSAYVDGLVNGGGTIPTRDWSQIGDHQKSWLKEAGALLPTEGEPTKGPYRVAPEPDDDGWEIISADNKIAAWALTMERAAYVAAALNARHFATPQESAEVERLREAIMTICPAEDGFTEHMDELITMGLLVEVPADEHFKEWWDPDAETMYVWAWSDLARAALNTETDG